MTSEPITPQLAPPPGLLARVRLALTASTGTAAEDRARERQRRVLLTAGASALAKAVSMATMLVSVPLTLHYLGEERYGMWITISSFALMLSFADFGIGNGLLTAVSRANGRDDMGEVRTYVSTGAFVLGVIGLVAALIGLIAVPLVNWVGVFRLAGAQAMREAEPAMLSFALCFAASIPLTLIQRVQFGLQRGFLSSLWQCASSLAVLASVLTAVSMRAPLFGLVLAFLGPPLVVGLINSLVFFTMQMPRIAPALRGVSSRHAREILRMGGMFFVLQVTVAVAYLSDSFVISRILGAAHVTDYSIADRMFSVVSLLIGFVVVPLWPAFGEALERGDTAWARRTLIRGTVLSFLIAGTFGIVLTLLSSFLIRIWIGNGVTVPLLLIAGFALWRVIEATVQTAAMFLNALQAVRFQVVTALCTAVVAISAKIYLLPHLGVSAMPWITICVYLTFTGFPLTWYVWCCLKRPELVSGRAA